MAFTFDLNPWEQTAPTFTTPTSQPLSACARSRCGGNPGCPVGRTQSKQWLHSPGSLVLSPAAPELLPGKLVDKVRSCQFVEMLKLLGNNITFLRQPEAVNGYSPLHDHDYEKYHLFPHGATISSGTRPSLLLIP